MNKRFKYLVERYLERELTRVQRMEFSLFLKDPECAAYLKNAVRAEKLMMEGQQLFFAEEVEKSSQNLSPEICQDFDDIISRHSGRHNPKTVLQIKNAHRAMLRRKAGIRAAAYSLPAAVVVGILLVLFAKTAPQAPGLFETYYRPNEFIVTRGDNDYDAEYARARDLYIYGQYSASLKICRDLLQQEPVEPETNFLYGLNLIELDSLQGAISRFRITMAQPLDKSGLLYSSAQWYAGLAYLGQGMPDSAIVEMDALIVESAFMYERAERLKGRILEEMRK